MKTRIRNLLRVMGTIALLTPLASGATELVAPNLFYEPSAFSVETLVLGRTCFSLPATRLALTCNPAFMAREEKQQLRANLYLDNHVEEALSIGAEVRNRDTRAIVNRLLERREAAAARLTTAIWYQSDWWSLGYVPTRMAYVTETRNPAYPEIALHAHREFEISLKGGLVTEADPRLSMGLQLRYVDRLFVREEMALLEALSNLSLIKVESAKALLLEPGIAYTFNDEPWSPVVSAMLTDLAVYAEGPDEGGTSVVPEIGFSSRPPFLFGGRLVTSTHLSMRRNVQIWKRLRWGAVLETELVDFSLGLAKGDYGIGASASIQSLTFGAGYKYEEINTGLLSSKAVQSIIGEVGLRF